MNPDNYIDFYEVTDFGKSRNKIMKKDTAEKLAELTGNQSMSPRQMDLIKDLFSIVWIRRDNPSKPQTEPTP